MHHNVSKPKYSVVSLKGNLNSIKCLKNFSWFSILEEATRKSMQCNFILWHQQKIAFYKNYFSFHSESFDSNKNNLQKNTAEVKLPKIIKSKSTHTVGPYAVPKHTLWVLIRSQNTHCGSLCGPKTHTVGPYAVPKHKLWILMRSQNINRKRRWILLCYELATLALVLQSKTLWVH